MMNIIIRSILGISFLLFLSNVAFDFEDWKEKVDPVVLEKVEQGELTDFIIQLKSQAKLQSNIGYQTKFEKGTKIYNQLTQIAQFSQKEVVEILESNNAEYKSYWVVNVVHAKGDIHLIEKIANLNSVAKITRNQRLVLQNSGPVADTRSSVEWGLDNINVKRVWALGIEGEGVVVAGQDTGVEWFHPAIKNKYRGLLDSTHVEHDYNWHDAIHTIHGDTTQVNPCGLNTDTPCDDHNHGTHTIGTMVGGEDDMQTKIGVAPKSKWIACRNMERGDGTPITYIECFQWLMAPTDSNDEHPKVDKAPHVINNSWGCPNSEGCDTTNYHIMEKVVDNIKASGIVVVVSAGNSGGGGCGSVSSPAAIYENSFTIGATADIDVIAGFSSKGPVMVDGSNRMKPNVSAPGVNVRSCIRNGLYANWNGTSMAGPHVAGVVALMINANPSLSGQVDVIEDIIESTARPQVYNDVLCGQDTMNAVPNNAYGHGIVDAFAAVKKAMSYVTDTKVVENEFDVTISPNPINDFANLSLNNVKGDVEFTIYDVHGRLISQENFKAIENYEVDFRKMVSGVYFYEVRNGVNVVQGKLIRR